MFILTNFSATANLGKTGLHIFTYHTTDTLETVIADNYFYPVMPDLAVNNWILVNLSDTYVVLRVTERTSHTVKTEILSNADGLKKYELVLTGESGTLTDEQIAQVQDDTSVLEIVCDGEVFRLSNKDSTLTYRTFMNTNCEASENVSFKVIYVQLNPEAVNYGAWTLQEVSADSGELPDPTGLTDGTYVLKLVIADGVPTLSWVAE